MAVVGPGKRPQWLPGTASIFVPRPKPGRWRVLLRYAKDALFEINVGALRKDAFDYLRRSWVGRRCGACKLMVKASIAGVVAYAVSQAVPLVPAAAPTLAGIAKVAGVPEWLLEFALGELAGHSMDWVAAGACRKVGACPA